MYSFKSIIQKFANKGEKTGWTYIDIPPDIIIKLKLKTKKEFRVKGVMDNTGFERLTAYPTGNGNFMIALNNELRKKLGKKEGAQLSVKLEIDNAGALQSQELMDCLAEDKEALKQFLSQPLSHQNYFHNYINTAKTSATKASRIVHSINAMHKKQNFGEMIRSLKALK